jgi:hypothetical protein
MLSWGKLLWHQITSIGSTNTYITDFCWGFGGVAGAIIGGSCKSISLYSQIHNMTCHCSVVVESPALKWPDAFANLRIFVKYPYLLPCALAASITFTGELSLSNIECVM